MKGILTMKQNLWIINSSLVLIFGLTLVVYDIFRLEPPRVRSIKKISTPQVDIDKKKEEPTFVATWEKIFQNDIFGTFVPAKMLAEKKSFVTPIPEPQPVEPPAIPEPKKIDFVAPLNIVLRGIIIAADESKNVSMIADETGKENMYYLGDKIKDAQIIKITHNRLVLLRANGQQEVYYLRKEEISSGSKLKELQDPLAQWKHVVKKENDTNFEIDPTEFVKEIETLGHLLERSSIIGVSFKDGNPIGINVGALDPNDVMSAMGLRENDLIVSVNDIQVADQKNRLKAYDETLQKNIGDMIKLGIKRNNQDIAIIYKLVKIKQPRKYAKPGIGIAPDKDAKDGPLKMNRLQEREHNRREFDKLHPKKDHEKTMMDIRTRLLSNLKQRMYNSRNRK